MQSINITSSDDHTIYEAPQVIYEAPLEVRAGSPLSLPDLFDSTGTGVGQ